MQIKGLQKTTLIDFPGKVACIVFTCGCNWRCPYCHNPDLVEGCEGMPDIPESEVLSFLTERKSLLDGIVITGGEPTIHADLPAFMEKAKKIGYAVKLDTNGTNPVMLKEIISKGLADYVAMDIKGPPARYAEIANAPVDMEAVKKSVALLMEGTVPYEFRTTVAPSLLNKEDIIAIGKWLDGAERYVIQQFTPARVLDKKYESEDPYPPTMLQEMKKAVAPHFKSCEIANV